MPKKPPHQESEAASFRRAIATRRVGVGAKCACGEDRPYALIAGSDPVTCAECKRKNEGKTTVDEHHVAGKANSPLTISVPANDHRAQLSVEQYGWPKDTLRNPDGSPLLAAAACIRGIRATIVYLLDKLLDWIPEVLEKLEAWLVKTLGPKWWLGTPLEQFAPK